MGITPARGPKQCGKALILETTLWTCRLSRMEMKGYRGKSNMSSNKQHGEWRGVLIW
jgi:hypothetical protein